MQPLLFLKSVRESWVFGYASRCRAGQDSGSFNGDCFDLGFGIAVLVLNRTQCQEAQLAMPLSPTLHIYDR